MLDSLLVILAVSGVLFLGMGTLTVIETGRGKRLVAARTRAVLDRLIIDVATATNQGMRFVLRRMISLSWYYSLHAFFMLVLRFLASVYSGVESLLIRNRDRARAIRREFRESHLTKLSTHRAETKLTPAQKKKMKDKALKGL